MTSAALAALRFTVKSSCAAPPVPSVTLAPVIESDGWPSSFVIVPVPVESPSLAFVGFESATTTVSSASMRVSPVTETVRLFAVSPAAKVSEPEESAV